MHRDYAETIALKAAAYIFSEDETRDGFLALSGAALEDVRDALVSAEMQAGILDYLLGDERRLIEFCEGEGIAPEHPAEARRTLAGEFYA